MELTHRRLCAHISQDVAHFILDQFLGLPKIITHNSARLAGELGLYEFCDNLQHPFIDDAFLGAVKGEHMLVIQRMIAKGAYSVFDGLAYSIVENLQEQTAYLQTVYASDEKYKIYHQVSKSATANIPPLVNCNTNWNMLLTAGCSRVARHLPIYRYPMIFAIRRGASQCYACSNQLKAHIPFYKTPLQRFWATKKSEWREQCRFYGVVLLANIVGVIACNFAVQCVGQRPLGVRDSAYVALFTTGVDFLVGTSIDYRRAVIWRSLSCGHKVQVDPQDA